MNYAETKKEELNQEEVSKINEEIQTDTSSNNLYFKNCFTQVGENLIDASFNKTTIKCLDSANHNFSLDCDGNLIVNSITSKIKDNLDLNKLYPVGSIYENISNINPNLLFGGTWTLIRKSIIDTGWQNFSYKNEKYINSNQSSYTLNKWKVKENILYVSIGAGSSEVINTSTEEEIARIPIKGNQSFITAENRMWNGAVGAGGAHGGFLCEQKGTYILIALKPYTSQNGYNGKWFSTTLILPLDDNFSFTDDSNYDTKYVWKRVS